MGDQSRSKMMSTITIEGPMAERLRGATSRTTLCDPAGQPIGYVISEEDYVRLQYAEAWHRYTDAEIEEMRRQPREGISTKELQEALRQAWNMK
jgi:hypothetical protein